MRNAIIKCAILAAVLAGIVVSCQPSSAAAADVPAAPQMRVAKMGHETVYACNMGDRDAMYLNITRHRFYFVDHEGTLNEGQVFNFRTKAGYLVTMDLGDPDRLHFRKPSRVRGWGSVSGPSGSQGHLESIMCVRTR